MTERERLQGGKKEIFIIEKVFGLLYVRKSFFFHQFFFIRRPEEVGSFLIFQL